MPVDLAIISQHLKQGYFLQEDMDTLELSGSVTVAQMKAALASRQIAENPPPVQPEVDPNVAIRAQQAADAAKKEAQEAADRAALVASVQAQQVNQRIEAERQQLLQETLDRFRAAIQADPNVISTTP